MPEFTRVDTTKKEITHHLGDYEVLLSFFDDLGAEAFEEWWYRHGAKEFGDWCGKFPEFKGLVVK